MLLLGLASVAFGAHAEALRPAYLDARAEVILPVGYRRSVDYPVFVVLPPTGTYASSIAARLGFDAERQRDFVLILPPGRPTRDEYGPDFPAFVAWYEERVLSDLSSVLQEYSTDPDRVYIGGYSLGGDLSWALSARNPDVFAGAVMAGTRASYPITPEALAALSSNRFRGAFLIGDREDPVRHRGINAARALYEAAGIDHRYAEYPGGHTMPPRETVRGMVGYVTGMELPPPSDRLTGSTPSSRTPAGGLLTRPGGDLFSLRIPIPLELNRTGLTLLDEREVLLRIEAPWSRFYLRTTADYTSSARSTGLRERRISQDAVVGYGDPGGFFGVGLGWDWARWFAEGEALREIDVIAARADRDPWGIPGSRTDPNRIDSLLLVRYTIPHATDGGFVAAQLFNLHATYLLRIAERFEFDAAAGAYAVQNRPVDSQADLPVALDHRLDWQLGLGIKLPSPLLWRISYRGIAERPLPNGVFQYRGRWNLSLAYSW